MYCLGLCSYALLWMFVCCSPVECLWFQGEKLLIIFISFIDFILSEISCNIKFFLWYCQLLHNPRLFVGLHYGVSNQSDLLTSILHIICVILGNTPEWDLNEYGIDSNRNVCEQLSLLKYKRFMGSLNMLTTILTFNMLICFKGYNRDIYILNGLCLTQVDEINPGTIMYAVCPTQLISCLLMLWRL